MRSSEARAQPTAIAATSGRVLSKVAIAPAKPCFASTSGEPSRLAAGTRQSSKRMVAVSEARMPSLCSSRSTRHAGRALRHDERLDRGAAQRLVERRPHHDGVGPLAGGDVDLLAVEDVVVAVERRGRRDVGGVGAGARLGDRHRGPEPGEPPRLLLVGHRRDGGVAEALARQREQQTGVAPAHLRDRQHGREVGPVAHARRRPSASSRRTPTAPAPSPWHPTSARPSIIAASMSSSTG